MLEKCTVVRDSGRKREKKRKHELVSNSITENSGGEKGWKVGCKQLRIQKNITIKVIYILGCYSVYRVDDIPHKIRRQ